MTIDGWTIEPHNGSFWAVLDESRSSWHGQSGQITTCEVVDGELVVDDGVQYYPAGFYEIPLAVIDELRARAGR